MSTVPSETDDDFSEKCLQMAGLLEGFRRLVPKDLSADVVAEITAPARMAFRRKYCPESLPVTMLNDTLQRSHRFFPGSGHRYRPDGGARRASLSFVAFS